MQAHVARLKQEEEVLSRQASEKRVTALTELRSFLKEVRAASACHAESAIVHWLAH